MKILITGNMGYVGPVLVEHLRAVLPDAELVGLDTGYFAGCVMDRRHSPERFLRAQIFTDVRDFDPRHLEGVDAVVHLAAISNDPMGKAFEDVTRNINEEMTVRIATQARAAGVRHFVFASSCSVYGTGGDEARTEESPVAPLTAYARSKVGAEARLVELSDDRFTVTSLRFATACGYSPRLRLDLVLNDFVASASTIGRVVILSDGTPWRPLIHVRDMARAIEWGIVREAEQGGASCVVNVGSNVWNYQIRDLALAVRDVLPDVDVDINQDAEPDKRSYRVAFDRYAELAPDHQPRVGLEAAVNDLVTGLRSAAFDDPDFRNSYFVRLRHLEALQAGGQLDSKLFWCQGGAV